MLLNSWESLDYKEIKPVNPKVNQPWIFMGRTDAEAEAPILWPPDTKRQLPGKDHDAGKDWGQEEKGTTEDEMVGLHYWLNGHESEQTLGDSAGQGSLMCCNPWGCRVGHDWATDQQHLIKKSYMLRFKEQNKKPPFDKKNAKSPWKEAYTRMRRICGYTKHMFLGPTASSNMCYYFCPHSI